MKEVLKETRLHPTIFDIELVNAELLESREKLLNLGKAVSIFGSARLQETDPFYQMAFELAEKLSAKGISIITGGGPGIMEAANKGCQAGKNGQSIGLNIKLPKEQTPNSYQDLSLFFQHFLTRKTIFMDYSSAFICVPGGFGTLDEVMEAMTLIQTKKMVEKPVILVGKDFWKPLLHWFDTELLDHKMIAENDSQRFMVVDSIEEVMNALKLV
ncbi:LOG family protein [Ignatzschineria sp. LJL83]